MASSSHTQPAWNVELMPARQRGALGGGVVVVAAAAAAAVAAAVHPRFLPVHCELSSGLKGAKHIKHTRRAAGDPCETQWVTRTAAAA